MSSRPADAEQYSAFYAEALAELNLQSPELAKFFLSQIISDGYSSEFDLSPEDRFYRLMQFFEYYIMQVPKIIEHTKKQQSHLNEKLKGTSIEDVELAYSLDENGQEIKFKLSSLQVPDVNAATAEQKFNTMLTSGNFSQRYAQLKNAEGVRKTYEY